MSATTHEKLEQILATEEPAFSALAAALAKPASYFHALSGSIYLMLALRRVMPRIEELDTACLACENECRFPFQKDLKKMRDTLSGMLERDKKNNILPFFFKRYTSNVIDRLDDKLENYALASDDEIKSLVTELSQKLDHHARD